MSSIFRLVPNFVRGVALIFLSLLLVVCSGDNSTGTIMAEDPGTVSDLTVAAASDASVTLSFTQVDDGMGDPAKYEIRYAAGPLSWQSANSVAAGSCATPLVGSGIGTVASCEVQGLAASTSYNFQAVAFRGTMSNSVRGGLSNIVSAATTGSQPPPPVVTTVSVSPPSATISIGGAATLQATVKDQNDNVMTGQGITWTTDKGSVATVSSDGVVTGVAAGSATISAATSGKSASASITVTADPPPPPVVTTVTVSPPSASITVGGTSTLQAIVKDQNGNVMTGQSIAWTTDKPSVATVNASGVVTAVAAGSATISAATSGKSGSASITVTAAPAVVTTVTVTPPSASVVAGATVSLQAVVKDQYGIVMTGQNVTWATDKPAVATVSSSGVVTGVAAGSATITASSSGKSGSASITVTAPTPVVTTVTVTPPSTSVEAGSTTTLQAVVKDQNGNVMTGQAVTWTTDKPSIATVSSSGVVTGVAAGSATITATSSGKFGTSSITVTPPASGNILFQEDFEKANLAGDGWYDNTSAEISTAEHFSGSSSAQYHFLKGATTPTSGSAQRHKFTAGNSVYISYYVKYSTNWVGTGTDDHPHEFYVLSNLDADYDGPSENFLTVYVEQNYLNGGRPRVAMQDNKSINTSLGALPNNLISQTENRSTGGCNGVSEVNIVSECFKFGGAWYNDKKITAQVEFQPNPGPGYKNNWNLVEAYFQLNTIVGGKGQPDGVIQYWFNGSLIIDRHDIMFRTGQHATLQFNQFLIAPYMGDGSPVDQTMWVDNLRVGTSRTP